MTVYVPGASGESKTLIKALQGDPERARGVNFCGCLVPGMNEFDYAGLHAQTRATVFMLPHAMRQSFGGGKVDLVPRSYVGAAASIARMHWDVAYFHVAPPAADGSCSFGIASDFAPIVWERARWRIAIVNARMPTMARGPRVNLADADAAVEASDELIGAPTVPISHEVSVIASSLARLIPDGAHVQTGIGGAPAAVWRHLRGHRNLVLRSGMATDPVQDLAEAGALRHDGDHCAGIAYGSREFYDYLARSDLVRFASTPETHGFASLAPLQGFHAVNSALEVDLFGQVNVEWRDKRLFGGVGGAPDFARAAQASPGGRSIIALPSTAKSGALSRIVPRLGTPTISMARSEIDTVVTEHGVADLRDKSTECRAKALIAIAAPAYRESLCRAWHEVRTSL